MSVLAGSLTFNLYGGHGEPGSVYIVITAVAVLLAGVLGSMAGGLADYRLQRRRERARARAGARLLRSDLRIAAGRFAIAATDKVWRRLWGPSIDSWDEYRDILAAELDADRWNVVARAVSRARQIESHLTVTEKNAAWFPSLVGDTETTLRPNDVALLLTAREDARLAYNELADLAEGPLADEIFGTRLQGEQQQAHAAPNDDP